MEGNLVSKAVEFVDHGVVGVEVREEEGHGDTAVVGIKQVLEAKVEVLIGDSDGIVKTQDYKLWHIINI